MFANSRSVTASQQEVHPALAKVLARHFASVFCRPILDYNRAAFAEAIGRWQDWNGNAPLILDSGCGVGWSTLTLAEAHPDCFVLGVDQSAHRLARIAIPQNHNTLSTSPCRTNSTVFGSSSRLVILGNHYENKESQPDNLAFIRADLVDFWRLLADRNIRLSAHYLLYPNPWPKAKHLQRRWHGHPVFPALLSLGGRLECRSNWKIYLDELEFALTWAGYAAKVTPFLPEADGLTPFERKYHASGQELWRLVCDLRTHCASPEISSAKGGLNY